MRKGFIYAFCTVMFLLFCTVAAYSGEQAAGKGDIPQKELAAYQEVAQLLKENPSITTEEIDALLAKNELTRKRFEEIDQRVQADPQLLKSVKEDTPKPTALEEFEKIPGVRTKLKKPAPPEIK